MRKSSLSFFAGVSMAIALASSAVADFPTNGEVSIGTLGAPSYLMQGARAARPFAHVLFCKANPNDCRNGGADRVALSGETFELLLQVNTRVNAQIAPRADDYAVMGGDVWTLSPESGDCEDYAITKRHHLLQNGWPANAMRLAQVLTRNGQPHMVLVVTTDHGDLVLDNLSSRVLPWDKTGLRWELIQSASNSSQWYQAG